MATRRFFCQGLASLALCATPGLVWADGRPILPPNEPRTMAVMRTQTEEIFNDAYWTPQEGYLPDALAAISRIFRDVRTGETENVDPALVDVLARMIHLLGYPGPFNLTSGFRPPETNEKTDGAAEDSFHTRAKAADVYFAGRDLEAMRKAAVAAGAGGVGYYPPVSNGNTGFIHVDTGPRRRWTHPIG